MLVIREEQRRILNREALANGLCAHARKVAPEVCAGITSGHLRSIVQYCLNRCKLYGLTRHYDIYRYLNLMLVFGFTFDQDQPWATRPLSFRNPAGRMDLLMDFALMQIRPSHGDPV
jgi:hypothetical protein